MMLMKRYIPLAICIAAGTVAGFSGHLANRHHLTQSHQTSRNTMHMMVEGTEETSSSRRMLIKNAFSATSSTIFLSSPAFAKQEVGGKIRYGDESIMENKAHGSTQEPVQESLRYGVSRKVADRICSYNRRFAEFAGYFEDTSLKDVMLSQAQDEPITFYDSVTGKPLFKAPIGRSTEEFLKESSHHGWPSFRDEEVVWDNVRILRNSGETVSADGTHLGHNIPDKAGNRYCINLVSVAVLTRFLHS